MESTHSLKKMLSKDTHFMIASTIMAILVRPVIKPMRSSSCKANNSISLIAWYDVSQYFRIAEKMDDTITSVTGLMEQISYQTETATTGTEPNLHYTVVLHLLIFLPL